MTRMPVTTFLTDADVQAVFDWGVATRSTRCGPLTPFPRTRAGSRRGPWRAGDGAWLRTLSGIPTAGGFMGAKLIAGFAGHSQRCLPDPPVRPEDRGEEQAAVLDGNAVTGFRHAATSALAVDVLAPARPLRVGVIGSGFEARHHVRALAATRDLTSVTVFSPNPASRARFTEHLAELAVPLTSAESAEEAVSGADLVVCAARSRDEQPTLRGAWLEPGMLVPLSDAVAGRVAGRRWAAASCSTSRSEPRCRT